MAAPSALTAWAVDVPVVCRWRVVAGALAASTCHVERRLLHQFSSTFSCTELAISISPRKHFRFLTSIYFINCDVPEWKFRIRRIRKNMQKHARKCKNMQGYVQYIIPNKALGISTPQNRTKSTNNMRAQDVRYARAPKTSCK